MLDHDLIVARFGSPAEPVIILIGQRARELMRDLPLLFGTLDELGCVLAHVRAMSLEDRTLVVAKPEEPTNTLTPILMMTQALARDALDGQFADDKQHAMLARPAQVRQGLTLAMIDYAYFDQRFPEGRAPTRIEHARALGLVDRFDRAAALLHEELREHPDSAPVLFHLGTMLHTRLGKPAEAIPLLQRSAALAPDQLDPRSALAFALTSCGRHAEAKQVYLELIQMTGGDFGEWMNLATVCGDTGDLDEGRRAVERALGLDPRSAHAHALAAQLAAAQGDRAAAAKHCETAAAYLAGVDRESPMHGLIEEMITKTRAAMTKLSRPRD